MNKVYRYKNYVDINGINSKPSDQCESYRYLLYVPYKNKRNKKNVLVILKNPSEANKEKSDHTINNVLKFCKKDYGGVYIMNLFPCYSTDPKGVKKFIESNDFIKIMQENRKILKSILSKTDEVIVAWGGNSIGNKREYDNAINLAISDIKSSNRVPYAVRISGNVVKREYPWHAQVWAVKSDLELYIWD